MSTFYFLAGRGLKLKTFRKLPSMNALYYILLKIAEENVSKQEELIYNRSVSVVLISRQFLGFCELYNQKLFSLFFRVGAQPP